jgi:hypothetical protein
VFVIVRLSDPERTRQQTLRTLRSVKCDLRAEPPRPPELGLALPPGFGRTSQGATTLYYGVKGSVLSVSSTDGAVVGSPKLVPFLGAMLGSALGARGSDVDLRPAALAHLDPDHMALFEAHNVPSSVPRGSHLFVGALYCEDLDLTYFLIGTGPELTEDRWGPILRKADCHGKSPEEVPSAREVLRGACEGGNAVACETLKQLPDGPAAPGSPP